MLIFLIGLVALILFRTLKKDFIKIARDFDDEEEGLDVIDETGWKQIHGDVFRYDLKYRRDVYWRNGDIIEPLLSWHCFLRCSVLDPNSLFYLLLR